MRIIPCGGKPSSFRGKKHTEETKKKIREARSKQIYTEETRRKMSESHKGKKHHFYGKKLPEETKEKLRIAKLGKKTKPHTEESKRRMSEIAKQRPKNHPSNMNLKHKKEFVPR